MTSYAPEPNISPRWGPLRPIGTVGACRRVPAVTTSCLPVVPDQGRSEPNVPVPAALRHCQRAEETSNLENMVAVSSFRSGKRVTADPAITTMMTSGMIAVIPGTAITAAEPQLADENRGGAR